MTLVVRTISDDTGSVAGAVREQVRMVDKDQPVSKITSMSRVISDSVGKPRFNALLITVFGAMALGLAAVGIFAVINYSVQQRAHELGVRMALRARPQDVFRLIVGDGLILTVKGTDKSLFEGPGSWYFTGQ
jgi:putative ABC transport system permease protein